MDAFIVSPWYGVHVYRRKGQDSSERSGSWTTLHICRPQAPVVLDADGDLEVSRFRPKAGVVCSLNGKTLLISHVRLAPRQQSGLMLWASSLLLCDHILSATETLVILWLEP